ncbi:hypothetical protein BJF90_11305 [Pseudonocardia sp. CNS-004]|nr:hypothetical protein BJF90_11305 [Pseudonocardia sp. CNS-004]
MLGRLTLLGRLAGWLWPRWLLSGWGHRPLAAGHALPVVGHAHPLLRRSVLRRPDDEFAGAYCE